jgi:hypothetical protein
MTVVRPPKKCGLFRPGHTPHWIQIFKATEDRVNLPSPGRLLEARPDGTVIVAIEGEELLLWHHQPERIREAASVSGGVISYQPRWGMLWVPRNASRYAFCVASAPGSQWECPTQPAARQTDHERNR